MSSSRRAGIYIERESRALRVGTVDHPDLEWRSFAFLPTSTRSYIYIYIQ